MRRMSLLILGIVAAATAHAQTYTPVEYVLTPWDDLHLETGIFEVQRPGQALHLTGFFTLARWVYGSSNTSVPWRSPFEALTADRSYDVPFDVSGTGSTPGQHCWVRLNTKIQSGHDKWQVVTATDSSTQTRTGNWENANGSPYMVIMN